MHKQEVVRVQYDPAGAGESVAVGLAAEQVQLGRVGGSPPGESAGASRQTGILLRLSVVAGSPSGFIRWTRRQRPPRLSLRGSASRSKVLAPAIAVAAARLIELVVLPTPPFWLETKSFRTAFSYTKR